jgi:hypothetical protein
MPAMSASTDEGMSAIERCRSAALSGRVARCEDCAYTVIAYNSCRNRHAQNARAQRQSNGSPSVRRSCCLSATSTSSSRCKRPADIACQNNAVIYDLLILTLITAQI